MVIVEFDVENLLTQ